VVEHPTRRRGRSPSMGQYLRENPLKTWPRPRFGSDSSVKPPVKSCRTLWRTNDSLERFKKQCIRVRWQGHQQNKSQIRFLEMKNDEMEEDMRQLERQCHYWKDLFKRTLKQYKEVKNGLRKVRVSNFERDQLGTLV
jgi:hypothetical protein